MIDSITLFQKHTPNSGNIYQFNCKNNRVCYLYARQNLTDKDLTELEALHKYEQPLEILHRLIQNLGGGLIIQVTEGNKTQKTVLLIKCVHVANKGYIPPEKWFILHPVGKRCETKNINYGKTETFPLNYHIIIPVDKTHQKELSQFLNYLSWYTPDLESLVLHSIRNPLLEARVTSLEENLEILMQKQTIPNTSANLESGQKWPSWLKPLSIGIVMTLLIVQLVILSLLLYKHNEQSSLTETTLQQNQTATTAKKAEKAEKAESKMAEPQKPIEQAQESVELPEAPNKEPKP